MAGYVVNREPETNLFFFGLPDDSKTTLDEIVGEAEKVRVDETSKDWQRRENHKMPTPSRTHFARRSTASSSAGVTRGGHSAGWQHTRTCRWRISRRLLGSSAS